MINFKDVESQVKDFLKRAGYKQPNLVKERGASLEELLEQELSDPERQKFINSDYKLFVQSFFEFCDFTEHVSEIHDFIEKMWKSSFIVARDGKLQLLKNLLKCFKGCKSSNEITLYTVLIEIMDKAVTSDNEAQMES